VKIRRYLVLKVRPYLTVEYEYGTLFLWFHSLPGAGLSDVKYSHTRYKLRRCDSRDRVWTLLSLRDRNTKENAYPGGLPFCSLSLSLSLSPSFPLRPLMQIHWLSTTHLVKVYREASTEFPGLGPREKFNMRLSCASRVRVTRRERERGKVVRRRQTRRYDDIKRGI